jgi:CubicO group peptidase (beta-lactamase class C family)
MGYLCGELVRRITGRSLGQFVREEICLPLNVDFHFGLSAPDRRRCAEIGKGSLTKERGLGDSRMNRQDVFRMIKKRCRQSALGAAANCHTFRATGITAYMLNGGTLEHAQTIAAQESPRGRPSFRTERPMKSRSMRSNASESDGMTQV